MHLHQIVPWMPGAFQPAKKPVKPRKTPFADESEEASPAMPRQQRPSDILDEEQEHQHVDIEA